MVESPSGSGLDLPSPSTAARACNIAELETCPVRNASRDQFGMQNLNRFQENARDGNVDVQLVDLCLSQHFLSNSSIGRHNSALQATQCNTQLPQLHLAGMPWRTPRRRSPFPRQEQSRIPAFQSLIFQAGSALDHAISAASEAFEVADRRQLAFLNFRQFLDALQYLHIDMAFSSLASFICDC